MIADLIRRIGYRPIRWLSARRTLEEVPVYVAFADDQNRDETWAKLSAALALVRAHDRRALASIRQNVDHIIVFERPHVAGMWRREERFILVEKTFAERADVTALHVAATIVHEATHAWLESLGIQYLPSSRRRIEAICYRAQAAFARRAGGSSEVIASYYERAEAILAQPESAWDDAAFVHRELRRMDALATTLENEGVPTFVVAALRRWGRGDTA